HHKPAVRVDLRVPNPVVESTTQRTSSSKDNESSPFLDGKKTLLRLQQDFPTTEAAANAVEDVLNASKSSSRSLKTLRLWRALLLGSSRAHSFRSTKGAIDASGMAGL